MRSFALTLVAWVLTSACSLAGPGSPSEDVLARGPTAAAAPPPIAAGQHRPPTAVTTITCRSRTDCEPEQVCVATRPGISECLERRDVAIDAPADGPEGQLAPPAGMLSGSGRLPPEGKR